MNGCTLVQSDLTSPNMFTPIFTLLNYFDQILIFKCHALVSILKLLKDNIFKYLIFFTMNVVFIFLKIVYIKHSNKLLCTKDNNL